MRHFYVLLFFLILSNSLLAQLITTDTSLPADQLVTQALGNDCIQISNVTSTVNGSVDTIDSFGSFDRASSNFPFLDGFFISNGRASEVGNTAIATDLSSGTNAWVGDADLESNLGITTTRNATVIEFDLISVADRISFNYIMASEEYQRDFPCNVADGFALLIRQVGTTAYQNIALVPGTTTAVGIDTVHPEVVGQCQAENETFFAGNNLGDTNFEGRTVVLNASATVIPNTFYQLKMVVADQFDTSFDTAVFIEAGSLQAEVNLGPDLFPCQDATLDADIGNNLATYRWLRDGVEITGQSGSTLLADTTGVYTVEVSVALPGGGNTCILTDEVAVTIDANQLNLNLGSETLCDDVSGDGVEPFDLNAISTNVLNLLPAGNYSVDFYLTQADATAGGANNLVSPYTNTSSPQTIYVRLTDLNTNCIGVSPLDLIISLPLDAQDITDTICDTDDNGITSIDLTGYRSQITTSTTASVSFFESLQDAQNDRNQVGSFYTNATPTVILFARVEDPGLGCFTSARLEITVNVAPEVLSNEEYIDACDQDYDNFATFDLTSVIDDIVASAANFTVTYHLTNPDAQNGQNAIATPTAFQNTIPETQTIYVRIEDPTTGCFSVANFVIWTNRLLDATNIVDYIICDLPPGDGIGDFLLEEHSEVIINNLEDISIEWFINEPDQLADINQLDPLIAIQNTINPQPIFLRINGPNCTELVEILLIVEDLFLALPLPDQDYCDEDDDLVTNVALSTFDANLAASQTQNTSMVYYASQADAQAGAPSITSIVNPTPTFTVWVRVVPASGCADIQPLTINVIAAPSINQPTDITICDDDQDGRFIVDLTSRALEINTDTNLTFTYHNSFIDAGSGANPITTPDSYNAGFEVVYVRLENSATGCFAVQPLQVIVTTLPDFPVPIEVFQICETDNDGVEDFFLAQKDNEILNGQSGKRVRYFTNMADANAGQNEIDGNVAYANTSNPQMIYARVENIALPSCFGVDVFEIRVDESPNFIPPTDFTLCDDDNDGITSVDLSVKTQEIVASSAFPLSVTYHLTNFDAENGTNEIPVSYTNTVNPQLIFARVGNDENCFVVESFEVNVVDSPVTNAVAASQLCDDDLDGLVTFDLLSRQPEIVGARPFNSIITWHISETDADNDLNPITDPSQFDNTSNPQTVYLRMFNTISGCHTTEPLELVVNVPPALIDGVRYEVCATSDQVVDFSTVENELLVPFPAGVSLSYYSSLMDAQNESNPLDASAYTYTNSSELIYVRATDTATCFYINNFTLIINPLPVIAGPGTFDIEVCDDDFDGIQIFDISGHSSNVLAGLSPTTHQVSYFFDDGQGGIGAPVMDDFIESAGERIWVSVVHLPTGCETIGQFELRVIDIPEIDVPYSYVICEETARIDAFTGDPTDRYLWNTGATSSAITVAETGNYSVQITNSSGCVSPVYEFEVRRSSPANLDLITTVSFNYPDNSIIVEVSGTGTYLYALDNGVPQRSNVFTNLRRGYHDLFVIDLGECETLIKRRILIFDYPRFFTPNGDRYNDTWTVEDIEEFDEAVFYIFERHGKLLKNFGKTSPGWDGTLNGEPLPSSDYWFVLEVKDTDGDFEVKGHFSLKR